MAWAALTESNLKATLSAKEVDAFSASFASDSTPVLDVLATVGDTVRGYIRASGADLSDTAHSVPPECVRPACTIAAWEILKRLPVEVGQDRRTAYEDALDFLRAIAAGTVAVEPASPTANRRAMPSMCPPYPERVLD